MDILEAIFQFFRQNPLLAILVIAGIAQSIGSAASSRKRESERQRRQKPEIELDRPHERMEEPLDPPRPVVQDVRSGPDELARRIREMLEESRSTERAPAPPPVPPAVEIEPAFDDEPEETRSLLGDLDIASRLPAAGGSLASPSDSSDWADSPSRDSLVSLLPERTGSSLPGGIDPRLAFFASVVLGPPRAFRSLEDERFLS